MTKGRGLQIALGVLWAGLGLSSVIAWSLSDIPLRDVPQLLANWLADFGVGRAILVALAIYTVRPLVLFPSSVLGVASGVTFGPVLGCAVTMLGELLGASLAFTVARAVGKQWVQAHERERIARWDDRLSANGISSVAIARLIWLPFDTISFACGLSRMRLVDFLLGTVLGGGFYILSVTLLGGSAAVGVSGAVTIGRFTIARRALVLVTSVVSFLAGLTLAWMLRHRYTDQPQSPSF